MNPLFRKLLHRVADYGYPDITITCGRHQTAATIRCPWSPLALRLTSDVGQDYVDVMGWSDEQERALVSQRFPLDSVYSCTVQLAYPHNGTEYILDELSSMLGPNPDRLAKPEEV